MVIGDSFRSDFINLTKHHFAECGFYRNLFSHQDIDVLAVDQIPYIPVDLFKYFSPSSSILKPSVELKSSGTLGRPSRVPLTREDSLRQIKALRQLFQKYVNETVFDLGFFPAPNHRQEVMTASTAAVRGFSQFARNELLYDDIGKISLDGKNVLVFGFTADIYELCGRTEPGLFDNASNVVVLFGGGWKRLESKRVSEAQFCQSVRNSFGEKAVIKEYYGLIEQVGSIYFKCTVEGRFHGNIFCHAIGRDENLNIVQSGVGLIQTMSLVPHDYPGHNLLTGDLGIFFDDLCSCGQTGGFLIQGRLPKLQVRGCSDAN